MSNIQVLAGPEALPDFKKIIPWKLVVVFILFSVLIIFIGSYYYRSQKKRIFQDEQNKLSAIASLKIGQIVQWHNERLGNSETIKDNGPLVNSFMTYFKNKNQPVLSRELTKWMTSVCGEYAYMGITILDLNKKERLSFFVSDTFRVRTIPKEFDEVIANRTVIMTDFLKSENAHNVYMDLLVPLIETEDGAEKTFGVMILQIDPARQLLPLIKSWPIQSKTAETLILRKEGDSVLYLSELRNLKNTSLVLKRSLRQTDLLASKAVSGFRGVAEGIDYLNKPVIGFIAAIPGFPWYMVAKVNMEEIEEPLDRYFYLSLAVIVLIVLVNASIFGLWIWDRQIKMYRLQLKEELALRESEVKFNTAFQMSPVSISLNSSSDNKFIDVNNTFLTDLGYTRDEVIGRTARELKIWVDESDREWVLNEIGEKGKVFGKVISYRTKSDKVIYGLTSISVVTVNRVPCNLATVINITENKEADNRLQQSEELFRKLFDNMLNGFAYCKMIYEPGHPPDFLYIKTNEAFESLTGLKNVDGKRASEAIPGIQEADPELLERYGRVALTGIPEAFESYVDSLKMWFSISVYCPNKDYFVAVFDVITTRKLAEAALVISEERYRNIFNSLIEGFCIIEMVFDDKNKPVDYRFLEINSAFEKQTGLINARGKLMRDLAPGHEDYWFELYGNVALKGESIRFENEAKALNRWFEVSASRVEDGEHNKVALYFNDITERKLGEVALIESEDKFKYFFDYSIIGKSITLPSGEIQVNKAFCDILGYTAEELTSHDWHYITHPDDIEATQRVADSLLSGTENSLRFTKRYLHKNGSVVWTDVSTSLRREKNGKPQYFMTSINDITDLKLAEEVLKNDEKRFREFIEALPQLFWTCRSDGPCDYLSKQWVEYTGIPESDQLGYGWLNQLHPADKDRTISIWGEQVKTGDSFDIEFRIRRYDGSFHWFKTRAVPLRNSEEKIVKWLGSNTDIDNLRQAEEQLKNYNKDLEKNVSLRTEQLESANKELEAFSYSVSHDLRAPLRSIHGFTKILLEDYEAKLDEEGKRICRIISSSASKMGELIDDLLSFSKIGRTSVNPSNIDMKKMTSLLFEGISSPSERKRIKVEIGDLHNAYGDVVLLGQVWTNLISNAIKYSSKKKISQISIGSTNSGKMVTYSIKDNGVGFDMQFVHKLFGVFQRLHSEAEFEGNGVGLAIVQRIVWKHGGKVWAESGIGNGATFYFSLPVNGAEHEVWGEKHKV